MNTVPWFTYLSLYLGAPTATNLPSLETVTELPKPMSAA